MGRGIVLGALLAGCVALAVWVVYEIYFSPNADFSEALIDQKTANESGTLVVESVVTAKMIESPESEKSINEPIEPTKNEASSTLSSPVELIGPGGRGTLAPAAPLATPDPAAPIPVAGEGDYPGAVQRLRVQAVWLDTQEAVEGTTVTLTRVKGGLIITRGVTDRSGFVEFEFPQDWPHVNLNFRNPKAMTAARGVDLPTQQPYVVRLQRGAVIFGRVLVDGTPVSGAEIQVVGKKNIWAMSGPNGEYEIGNFVEGDVKLFVRWNEYVSADSEEEALPIRIVLLGERRGPHDIELHRGRAVVGTIRDADTGQPIAGAEIEWERFMREKSRSDAAGNYRHGGLMGHNGEYHLCVQAKGYATQYFSVQFANEREKHLDLQMEKAGTVEVVVVDENGQPLPGVRILVSGSFYREVEDRTDAEGRFLLNDVSIRNPPSIHVAKEGYQTIETSPPMYVGSDSTKAEVKIRMQKETGNAMEGIVGALVGN